MKKNKSRSSRSSRKHEPLPVGLFVGLILIVLVISLAVGCTWKLISTADYFTIKEVIVRQPDVADFSYLKGKNIFRVDLSDEIKGILKDYPNYKKIYLVRVLPNRIFVNFQERIPLAFVRLGKDFAVDETGTLFYVSLKPADTFLPVICGLGSKLTNAHPGLRNRVRELALALTIATEVSKNKVFREYRVSTIDVSNPDNATIFISLPAELTVSVILGKNKTPKDLEVRIGQGDLKNKVSFLSGLLVHNRADLANIEYIDLRFKDSVIKLKDKNVKQ